MNLLDLGVIGLLIIAVVIGFRSGALPQLCGLIGALGGGILAILSLPYLEGPLGALDARAKAFVVVAGILFTVGLGEAVGSSLGRRAAVLLGQGVFGALDRVLGAFVGSAQALLIVWLAGGLFAAGPSPTLAKEAQTSFFVRALNGYLPAPTEIATGLTGLLNDTRLPDLFVGLEPLPAPPLDLPSDPFVQLLADAAVPSIVKVTASTCLAQSTGTGFVVARSYAVTNAHVVAGATKVRLAAGDALVDAVPVFLDPELDVALLYAPQLTAPSLEFARDDPERGATGATFGFPGGRGLVVVPAAVAGAYSAQGRDIYGRSRVTRSILELRATIDQGDSGGPLVLADGTIGGVVFAEARTDEEVGYALTPTAVRDAVTPWIGRTGFVPTGECIH